MGNFKENSLAETYEMHRLQKKKKKGKKQTNKQKPTSSPSQHQVIIKRDTAPRNPHNEAELSFTKHSTDLTWKY